MDISGKILIISLGIIFLAISIYKKIEVLKLLTDFFNEQTYAVNLALFRIAVFSTLFFVGTKPIFDVVWLSGISKDLLFPPLGYNCISYYFLQVNQSNWLIIKLFFLLFCILSAIGLFTNISTKLATIIGFFILAFIQFYGKTYHIHHLFWFALILSASRCSDVLSIDSLIKNISKSHTDIQNTKVTCSNEYALPLRFAWLIIGIYYFFAGFWKLWTCGFSWFLTYNVKYHLYQGWSRVDMFQPIFRIDYFPIIYKASGFYTILFEMLFIFLIVIPRYRLLAIFSGLIFHIFTYFLMGISFWYLVSCYIAFFNWNALYNSLLTSGKSSYTSNLNAKIKSVINAKKNFLVCFIGITAILGNIYCGVLGIDTWPFAVYPRFNFFQPSEKLTTSIEVLDSNNNQVYIDESLITNHFDTARWDVLLQRVAKSIDQNETEILLKSIYRLLVDHCPEIKRGKRINFFRVKISIDPDLRSKNPISKELIYILNI